GKARAWLGDDAEHFKECHHRWLQESNRFRKWDTPEYRDEWAAEQCGACRYFIHLTGAFIADWGVCSNPSSPFDGTATLEHDGCDQFSLAQDGWGGPHRYFDHRRGHHYGRPPASDTGGEAQPWYEAVLAMLRLRKDR